jgi:alcohol dehydrogenase class IV
VTESPVATADDGVAWVRKLVEDLQIPRLGAYGVQREHVKPLVENATKASSMKANPIVLTRMELAQILECAL